MDYTNLKLIKNNLNVGNFNKNMNEKARLYFNNLIANSHSYNSEDKKNASYNAERESLNSSNKTSAMQQKKSFDSSKPKKIKS